MKIIIIAAVSENGVIGDGPNIPWHISEDFKRFKELTLNHPVIMGRKTFESIGKPLSNRQNIVLTRRDDYNPEGVVVVHSLDEALSNCEDEEVYIIGGSTVYSEAMPKADVLEITEVHQKVDGDVFFPEIDKNVWKEIVRDDRQGFSFVTYNKA